jgi:hypothetical protein
LPFLHAETLSTAEHNHSEEEVCELLEGELEVTIDGKVQIENPDPAYPAYASLRQGNHRAVGPHRQLSSVCRSKYSASPRIV